jgi:hypothetical protein
MRSLRQTEFGIRDSFFLVGHYASKKPLRFSIVYLAKGSDPISEGDHAKEQRQGWTKGA